MRHENVSEVGSLKKRQWSGKEGFQFRPPAASLTIQQTKGLQRLAGFGPLL
jgi:hypothetical protein